MASFTSIKQGLWQKHLHKKKALVMKSFSPQQNGLPSALYLPWKHRMDGKSICYDLFLDGELKENIFMSQLEGFVVNG